LALFAAVTPVEAADCPGRPATLGTGRVMPEKFTHGTSEQRVTWFKRGFDSGDPRQCDTFQ